MSAQPNSTNRLPVRNQGSRGTCAAFAAAAAHEFVVAATEHHSTEFVYWLAKGGDQLPPGASGTTIPAALGGILVKGGLTESDWQYGRPEFPPGPPPAAAFTGPFISAGFSYSKLPAKFDEIVTALNRGTVVIALAVQAGGAWRAPGGMLTPSPRAPVSGAHAVLGVRFDAARDAIVFKNSWGDAWGDAGYGSATRAYVDAHLLAAYEVS